MSDKLLMSGGLGKYHPSEAILMRTLAAEAGVPEESIFVEDRSTSTFENVRNCAKIMVSRGWRCAIVVTDAFHVPRCLYVFRSYGMDVAGSAPSRDRDATPPSKRIYYLVREILALPYYVVMLNLKKRFGRMD